MLTSKNDRNVHRFTKDATIKSPLHKKGTAPHQISILKSDQPNKPKQEPFATPASRIKHKKHHNCFPPPETPRSSKKIPLSLKMKSVSLVDLPSEDKNQLKVFTLRKTLSREKEDDPKLKNILKNQIKNPVDSDIFNFSSVREKELATKVCRKLFLHAWRKRRAQTNKLQIETESIHKKLENHSIQMCVLKTFLEADKERVTILTNKLNRTRNQLEEELKSSKKLKEQLSRQEVSFSAEKALWHSKETQMEEKTKSLKDELDMLVTNSLHLNEKALSYKQKLDDSRKNEVSLKDKLKVSDTLLNDKTDYANTLHKKCLDLQMAIEGLVTRNQELAREKEGKEKQIREYINNLKNLEVELNNFQNVQKVHSSDFVKLKNDYEEMKKQSNSKDLEMGCLQETVRLYEEEEKQLKNKFKKVALRVFELSLNLIPFPKYLPF